MDLAGDAGIVSVADCVDAVLFRIVEATALLQVFACRNKHAAPERGHAERSTRFQLVSNILLVASERKHFLGEVAGGLPFGAHEIVHPQPPKDRKPLPRSL